MSTERLASNPRFAKWVQEWVGYLSQKGWFHSIELPDGNVIKGLLGVEALRAKLEAFPIPADLTGTRVLDIGAWTGFYSFEMEKRGAEVVAADCVDLEEFHDAHRMIGSNVELRILDVDELSPETVGLFDYVLFFGVFYHLRNPLLGLEKICAITKEAAYVESYVIDGASPTDDSSPVPAVMEFYETNELGEQIDNWCGPNTKCLLAMCRSAGFARACLESVDAGRARVTCYRHWEEPPANPSQPPPWVHGAVNNRTNDIYFHQNKDEYICLYFKSPETALTRGRVRVEVDGYGIPALVLADLGRNGWQANFRVPPGLAIGPHEVRVRTTESLYSNTHQIIMREKYEPAPRTRVSEAVSPESVTEPAPVFTNLENNVTGGQTFHGYRNEYAICWFTTPETALKREDVLLELDGVEEPAVFLCDLREGAWQANLKVSADLKPGPHKLRVRTIRSPFSNELQFLFEPPV